MVNGEIFFDGNYPPGNSGEIDQGNNISQNSPNTPFSDNEESDSEMAAVVNCGFDKDGIRVTKKDRLRRQADAHTARVKLSQKSHEKKGGEATKSGDDDDSSGDQSSAESPTKRGKTDHPNENTDTS